MRRSILFFMTAILAASALVAQPKTIRVPQDQATVQGAIDAAANGDTVLVAEGTYNVNLLLKKKITLASLYLIDRNDTHIANTILDGGTPSKVDSASVIRIGTGTDTTTVIMGFTVRNGSGTIGTEPFDGSLWKGGGGFSIHAGGGARISHNDIRNNTIASSTRGVVGGGINIQSEGAVGYWIIEHNRIYNNVLNYSGASSSAGSSGGGAWLTQAGRFENNVVSGNQLISATFRTGPGIEYGSTLGSGMKTVVFANNLISSNYSGRGGGLLIYAIPGGSDYPVCTIANNIIASNGSAGTTGGIHVISGQYSLMNNTIVNNGGLRAIGLENTRGTLVFAMLNNIVWNPGVTNEFFNGGLAAGNYNLVRNGFAGTGNISVDPKFVVGDTLYALAPGSPGIGAGALSTSAGGVSLTAPSSDRLGTIRPRPTNSNPDLGATEHDHATIVEENVTDIPGTFGLEQNYPNPFNPETVIRYRISGTRTHVFLRVHDLLGRQVALLVDEEKPAGIFTATWNAANVPSGVYFYSMKAGSLSQTKRMLLLK